jgi:hypothetical protein
LVGGYGEKPLEDSKDWGITITNAIIFSIEIINNKTRK